MNIVKKLGLSFVLLVAAFCAQAATETVNGITWTYKVSNGKAEIYDDWWTPAIPSSTKGAITIPSTLGGYPVTSIGDGAFYECSGLTSVTIPDSVLSIGARAFRNCTSLKSVTLSEKLELISREAFQGCISLTNCMIPSNVSEIGSQAFDGCRSLQEIEIPKSIKTILSNTFRNCAKLKLLSFEFGLESIGVQAFKNCVELTNVTLPNTVTNLDSAAFSHCSNLVSIVLSSTLERIGDGAFAICESLKEITIPSRVKFIDGCTFSGCESLERIDLPKDLDYIGEYSFSSCSALKEIDIPDGVRCIGEKAFINCKLIKALKLPSKLEYIDNEAFCNMKSLKTLVVPDGVRYIGAGAFEACESLSYVKLGNKVREIGEGAFSDCKSLSNLRIPESVIRIGADAFHGCNDNLFDRHTIPGYKLVDGWIVEEDWESDFDSLDLRENIVLKNCRGIIDCDYLGMMSIYSNKRVEFPDGFKGIGSGIFAYHSTLTHTVIPKSVEYIGYDAFWRCPKELFDTNTISGVKMVDGWVVEAIHSGLVVGTTVPSLIQVDLSKAKGIMPSAFSHCYDLESVVWPKNLTRIESGLFERCDKLGAAYGTISIPDSVKHIGECAFIHCESIKSVVIPEGVEYIGKYAFYNTDCGVITNIVIPSSVIYIGNNAFNAVSHAHGRDEKTATAKVPLRLKSMIEHNEVFCEHVVVTYYDDGNGGGENAGNRDAVFEISVAVANGCEAMGKVTGGKTAKAGTKLTLKATANNGYVFSHWEGPLDSTMDPRSPSIAYVVGEEDAQFTAYFISVADFESKLVVPSDASVYVGYLSEGDDVSGTIQAKVAKPKNGSAKVTVTIEELGLKKVTVKGDMDIMTGVFVGTTKDGKTVSLTFDMDGISGSLDGIEINGARNFFDSKDKAEKAEAEAMFEPYLGAYAMICEDGTFSVTLAKKGKVTIKGTVDGAKVSAKAQALIGEDKICIPVVYSKKSVNLAFTIWLPFDGGEAEVVGLEGAVFGKAGTLGEGARFMIDGDIGEAIETEDARTLELLPNDEEVTVSGTKWLVADGVKAAKVAYKNGELTITEGKKGAGIVNPSGLKLTYKAKDGTFKGSFTAYAIVKGKLKKHKATVEGVLINGIGYGTATIKKLGSWPIVISSGL